MPLNAYALHVLAQKSLKTQH